MKYQTGERCGGHVVEGLSEAGNWIRCAGPFKQKSTAISRCKRMRIADAVGLRSKVGKKLISCKSWGDVDLSVVAGD